MAVVTAVVCNWTLATHEGRPVLAHTCPRFGSVRLADPTYCGAVHNRLDTPVDLAGPPAEGVPRPADATPPAPTP